MVLHREHHFQVSLLVPQGVETEEEDDLVVTTEGINTGVLAQLTARFSRWIGKKLPLATDVRAIQVRRHCGSRTSIRQETSTEEEVHPFFLDVSSTQCCAIGRYAPSKIGSQSQNSHALRQGARAQGQIVQTVSA